MEKPALILHHDQKGTNRRTLPHHKCEPSSDVHIHILKRGEPGEQWQMTKFDIAGHGRLMSYRNYIVAEATTFISEISEETICLRIQIYNESYNGFGWDKMLWRESDCFLFWHKDEPLESHLTVGNHMQLDLYMRKEHLVKFKELGLIQTLLDEEDMDHRHRQFHWCYESSEMDMHIFNVMQELGDNKPIAVERFNNLCDSLLSMCIGAEMQTAPSVGTTAIETPHYKMFLSEWQFQFLSQLDILDRTELIDSVCWFRQAVGEFEKNWSREEELAFSLWNAVYEKCEAAQLSLGLSFIKIAYIFDFNIDKEIFDLNDRNCLRDAIEKACVLSFEFRNPNYSDRELYTKWTKEPYLGYVSRKDKLLPDPKYRELEDSFSNGVLLHKTGFEFDVSDHLDSEKPIEVLSIYRSLMEHLSDTFTIEEHGIVNNEISNDLDVAFETNDVVTLLVLELEHLATDTQSLANYDDEKLKWFYVVLESIYQDFYQLYAAMEVDPHYLELRKYHEFGDDLEKLMKWAGEQERMLAYECGKLMAQVASLGKNTSRDKMIGFAHIMLGMPSYRGIFPTIT